MKFAVRRVLISILMLVLTSILVFTVLRLLPGDPVITRLGATPGVDAETIARLRTEAGLDDPIIMQYGRWVLGMLQGDFGNSYFNQYSVTELIGQRLPATLQLMVFATVLSVVVAVPLALLAARRVGGVADRIITTLSSLSMAMPQFIVGVFLVVLFSVTLGWLPARGYTPFADDPWDSTVRMILPSVTLAIAAAPMLIRFLRASLSEALDSSYIRTARGKGVSSGKVLVGHALRNSLIPGLTMLGLIVGYTLGGVVVIEYVFGVSGIGSLAIDSVFKRDYAILQSVVLLVSAMFIFTTLVVDLLAYLIDPRLRRGVSGA